MDNKTMCNVKNRSASMVVYRIPEEGIRREFAPGETKRLPYEELVKLSYRQGGRSLMTNFLQIQSEEATTDLNIKTEPEYHMSEQQIVDLLQNGSLDAFLDCLDFAPVGVIDLLKTYAVSIPLSDFEKRKAMKDKLGFDVDAAIKNNETDPEEARRAVLTPAGSTTPGRRTSGAGYIKKAVTAEE
jgi:hypothetical protein